MLIVYLLVYSDSANKLYVHAISNGAVRMQLGWTCYRLASNEELYLSLKFINNFKARSNQNQFFIG